MTRRNSSNKTNVWDFLTQTVLAAINKGQLLGYGLLIVVLYILFKMSSEDVSRLIFQTLAHLKSGALIGYALFFATLAAWFLHSRWLRKKSSDELEDVTHERNRLQEQVGRGKIVPSGRRHPAKKKKGD